MAQACNPSLWEAEAGRSFEPRISRPAWETQWNSIYKKIQKTARHSGATPVVPAPWRLRWEDRLSPRDHGYSEPYSHHCMAAWVREGDPVTKTNNNNNKKQGNWPRLLVDVSQYLFFLSFNIKLLTFSFPWLPASYYILQHFMWQSCGYTKFWPVEIQNDCGMHASVIFSGLAT